MLELEQQRPGIQAVVDSKFAGCSAENKALIEGVARELGILPAPVETSPSTVDASSIRLGPGMELVKDLRSKLLNADQTLSNSGSRLSELKQFSKLLSEPSRQHMRQAKFGEHVDVNSFQQPLLNDLNALLADGKLGNASDKGETLRELESVLTKFGNTLRPDEKKLIVQMQANALKDLETECFGDELAAAQKHSRTLTGSLKKMSPLDAPEEIQGQWVSELKHLETDAAAAYGDGSFVHSAISRMRTEAEMPLRSRFGAAGDSMIGTVMGWASGIFGIFMGR